ncbi:MAG TPA: hypothetical protein VLI05_05310 [Candidatus Saccharimonadia bacterium]|nr:hypothetical protein [Candidatus Saccharimonadia bacterium]
MYKPGYLFSRTPEERRDPFLFWKREDQPFFAAGACHILAEMFRQLHEGEDFQMIYLKPNIDRAGNHVYISYGDWAFDRNGWTLEKEMLDTISTAYKGHHPGWEVERIVIEEDFETFCRTTGHRLPWQFAYLPWERAYNFIKQFSDQPPA